MPALWLKRLVATAFVVGLMSVAVAAGTINVSHKKGVDFAAFKTYAMGAVAVTGDANPKMVQHMVSAVDRQMSALGFRKVQTDPDLIVNTQHWRGLSYPTWWSKQFSELDLNYRKLVVAQVVVELTDARSQEVVFSGTARRSVSLKDKTNERHADESVAELFDESPWGTDFDDD